MNKKSQIVIFALLGLVLLISFAFILYINNNKSTKAQIKRSSKVVLDSSSIASSVKVYVESCLDSTAKNGIHRLLGK